MNATASLGNRSNEASSAIILCVEDDPALRVLYWLSFGLEGYRCMPCESAEAELAALRVLPVALATLDFDMPGRNGADLARILRQTHPQLPLVLITGNPHLSAEDLEFFDRVFSKGTSRSLLFVEIANLLKTQTPQGSCENQPF